MNNERDRNSARQRDLIAADAAAWFARWQAGTVDQDAFARWRDADRAHALAFARVTAAWEACDRPVEVPEARVTRRWAISGGLAGAVLVAAGTGLFATRAYAWESASTGVGETRKLRLPDNSMVALNTDTELSWRFSAHTRELWLERGEIAIDLQAGPAAQLESEANGAALAPGRFNARLRNDRLDVTVLRGAATSAQAPGGRAPVKVQAYQLLSLAEGAPAVMPVSRDAIEAALAWQSGDIVFLDSPLSAAVAEYNRYLLHKIVIDDPAIGTVRVGGRFLSSDPSDFLRAISASLDLRVRTTDTGYHLSK